MYLHIPGLIDAATAANLIAAQTADPIAAGATAAGLRETLLANGLLAAAVRPRRVSSPAVGSFETGPGREFPLDDLVAGPAGSDPVRADLMATVFLAEPDSYGGGELVLTLAAGSRQLRLAAGDAVVHDAANYRRLAPVTSGVQWLASAAIQCTVRDDEERQVLAEIGHVLGWLEDQRDKDPATIDTALRPLRRARANLYRMWSEV